MAQAPRIALALPNWAPRPRRICPIRKSAAIRRVCFSHGAFVNLSFKMSPAPLSSPSANDHNMPLDPLTVAGQLDIVHRIEHLTPPGRSEALPLLSLVAVAALALTGCGGSSRPTATTARPASGSSPPTSRLTASADTICRRLNDELTATQPGRDANHADLARNALRHAALERQATKSLSGLTPPASLARDWAQILAYRRRLAAELVTIGHDWELNDTQAIRTLGAAKKQIHVKMATIASHDGFTDCSRVGSA
jgi:hypothetical protein